MYTAPEINMHSESGAANEALSEDPVFYSAFFAVLAILPGLGQIQAIPIKGAKHFGTRKHFNSLLPDVVNCW